MLVIEVLLAVAVLVGVAFVVSRDVAGLDDESPDHADLGLPTDRPLTADDVARLRFRSISGFWGGLRGYRYADVDDALDRIEQTMREHEAKQRAAARGPAPSSER